MKFLNFPHLSFTEANSVGYNKKTMYVKKCFRKYKNKSYETWWLVKSYREKGKVKHKYLCNISSLPLEKIEKIQKILGEK